MAKLCNIVGQHCCAGFMLLFQYCFISSSKSTILSWISLSSLIMGGSMVSLVFEELCHYLKLLLYPFMSAYICEIEMNCCPTCWLNWQHVAEQQMLPIHFWGCSSLWASNFFYGFVGRHGVQAGQHFDNIYVFPMLLYNVAKFGRGLISKTTSFFSL